MGLIDYFRILKVLVNLYFMHIYIIYIYINLYIYIYIFVCMNYVPNQNGKSVQEKTLASNLNSESNADAVKATMRLYVISKWLSLFFKFFKNLSPFFNPFVAYNREYYKLLCRLRHHIQVGRLLFQNTWLGLVAQSVIWESMLPTGQI